MAIGSFVNYLISGAGQREPEVGMAATICMWSDRNPATVVEVLRFKSGARKGQVRGVLVTEDNYKVVSGSEHDGSAQYEYTSNTQGVRYTFLINQRGQYVGKGAHVGGDKLSLGNREAYRDPSF